MVWEPRKIKGLNTVRHSVGQGAAECLVDRTGWRWPLGDQLTVAIC